MSLVEILELVAMLAIIVAIAWALALLVPSVWFWPVAIGVAGFGLLAFSLAVDRTKGGRG